MGLFNLTSINIDKNKTERRIGQLVGSSYMSDIYRFPQDIGNMDKGHYMVIHINEQIHTKNPGDYPESGDVPTIIQNRREYGTPTIQSDTKNTLDLATKIGGGIADIMSQSDSKVIKGIVGIGKGVNSTLNEFGVGAVADKVKNGITSESGVRTIKRTTETIALYMPDTLNFVHNQGYSEPSLGGSMGAGIMTAGSSLADSLRGQTDSKKAIQNVVGNLSPFFAQYAANKFGDFGKVAFASSFGLAQNPMLELLYQSPQFRNFRFDFMFYPRSEKEAAEVQRIINRLQFHQAPEIRKEYTSFFLVPPSEFDIKFYYNGVENPNIPKISTCVLEAIDVDYAPNGFSSYEVPGQNSPKVGGTGMPVGIRLGLQFKETEIMTKDHFQKKAFVDVKYNGSSNDNSMDWYE